MKPISRNTLAVSVFALAIAAGACKKEEKKAEEPAEPTTAQTETPEDKPVEEPPPVPEATEDDGADYIRIKAGHTKPKPTDPVVVEFSKFEIVSAEFDPANLEGATAELSIDLTSLASGDPKRDGHLNSPDYLDTASHPAAKVKITDVKKAGDKYTAKATVDVRGKAQEWPVEFEVVEQTEDSVTVKGSHAFKRTMFGVGKSPDDPDEGVAEDMTVELQLTFEKA